MSNPPAKSVNLHGRAALRTDADHHPDAWLCETCGYPMQGLHLDADCPECGRPLAESDPARRTGPLWQARPGPGAWIDIAVDLICRPRVFFRTLRTDGGNLPARLYLLSVACLVGGMWALAEVAWLGRPAWLAWAMGMIAAKATLVLTYIEAGGVAFFSKQRGWRVPIRLAERVCGYAALGWVLAAAALIVLHRFAQSGEIARVLRPVAGGLADDLVPATYIAVGGIAMLGFETLVYTGVRQVRFANRADPGKPA